MLPSVSSSKTATAAAEEESFAACCSTTGSHKACPLLASSPGGTGGNQKQSSNTNNSKKSQKNWNVIFPVKLHRMLEELERNERQHQEEKQSHAHSPKAGVTSDIISWLPSGRAFKVHNPERFEQEIMPKYFGTSKFRSFQKNLNMWGFISPRGGRNKRICSHPLFVRNALYLCFQIQRRSVITGGATAELSTGSSTTRTPEKIPGDSMMEVDETSESSKSLTVAAKTVSFSSSSSLSSSLISTTAFSPFTDYSSASHNDNEEEEATKSLYRNNTKNHCKQEDQKESFLPVGSKNTASTTIDARTTSSSRVMAINKAINDIHHHQLHSKLREKQPTRLWNKNPPLFFPTGGGTNYSGITSTNISPGGGHNTSCQNNIAPLSFLSPDVLSFFASSLPLRTCSSPHPPSSYPPLHYDSTTSILESSTLPLTTESVQISAAVATSALRGKQSNNSSGVNDLLFPFSFSPAQQHPSSLLLSNVFVTNNKNNLATKAAVAAATSAATINTTNTARMTNNNNRSIMMMNLMNWHQYQNHTSHNGHHA